MTGVLAFIGRSTFGLLRYASGQNLKHFTHTIKQQPFSLIRIKAQKDREPPIGK
jgi:Leu/Phe-tRNA-protein transferase